VKDSATPVLSIAETPKSVTVPGFPAGCEATVIVALPLFPSLVALTWADPAATPLTSPAPDTVAMLVLLELQLMVRPVRMFPFESLVVAESCTVDPTCTDALEGETVTVATGIGLDAAVVVATMFESPPKATPL